MRLIWVIASDLDGWAEIWTKLEVTLWLSNKYRAKLVNSSMIYAKSYCGIRKKKKLKFQASWCGQFPLFISVCSISSMIAMELKGGRMTRNEFICLYQMQTSLCGINSMACGIFALAMLSFRPPTETSRVLFAHSFHSSHSLGERKHISDSAWNFLVSCIFRTCRHINHVKLERKKPISAFKWFV